MMSEMVSASSTPSATPTRMPITPMASPWTMKMPMMERGVAPMVRRMAMSACLSVTTITRVETMLKAATAMITVSSSAIMRFSIWIAWKRLPWEKVQSMPR